MHGAWCQVTFLLLGAAVLVTAATVGDLKDDASGELRNGGPSANVVPTETTSQCSLNAGCPRSSMAWASGSFTEHGILTPQALALDTKLQLQLSLCCGYKFHGAMLRDVVMYDAFLDTLLYATPLRGLSMDEKRLLFPRTAAVITDTATHRRFDATYQCTEDDVAFSNDGDGDVLSLVTGPLGPSIHQLPAAASGTGDATEVFDVQLMLSNRVLKCKCPHTLHIMPLLTLHKDTLPPVAIRGGGARCASVTERQAPVVVEQRNDDGAPTSEGIVTTTNLGGSVTIPHTFHCTASLPHFSHVTWEVFELQRVVDAASLRGGGGVTATPTSTPEAAPILVHRSSVVTFLPAATQRHNISGVAAQRGTVAPTGERFTFLAEPNVRYQIRLYVVKGRAAATDASTGFVIREKILEGWERVDVPLEPFFGHSRMVTMQTDVGAPPRDVDGGGVGGAPPLDVLVALLQSPEYQAHWVVHASDGPSVAVTMQERRRVLIPRGAPAPNVVVAVERGYQQLRLMLSDIDDACPAAEVERHLILAVQLLVAAPAPSPFTVCTNTTPVEARDEVPLIETELPRRLGQATEEGRRRASGLSGNSGPLPLVANAQIVEQQWRCGRMMQDALDESSVRAGNYQGVQRHACMLSSTSSLNAVWELLESSVGVLQWSLRLKLQLAPHAATLAAAVQGLASRIVEAPQYGSVLKVTAEYIELVALSPPVVAFRRRASLPASVDVTVPTHALHVEFSSPRQDLRGLWKTSGNALRLTSPAASPTVRLDCSRAPNTPQDLPKGTLQFVVQDRGEVVSVPRPLITWALAPAARVVPASDGTGEGALSFMAKCPDVAVEYLVHLKTYMPVPPVPDHETVYTEIADVTLSSPRLAAKDERVVWAMADCLDDAATSTPEAVPQGDGVVVRGIAPHTHCNALWSAVNAAGATTKTFALRRCEVPPPLRFSVCNASDHPFPADGCAAAAITGVVRGRSAAAMGDAPFLLDGRASSSSTDRVVVLPFAASHRVTILPRSDALSERSRFATRFAVASGASWNAMQFTSEPYDAAATESLGDRSLLWTDMPALATDQDDSEEAHVVVEAFGDDSSVPPQQSLQLRPDVAAKTHKAGDGARWSRITEVTFATHTTAQGMAEPYAADMPQFDERRLCRPINGRFFVWNLQPLGIVASDLRDGTTGFPMIEQCSDVVDVARHPALAAFGYAWTWSCEGDVFSVTGISDVHHRFEHRGGSNLRTVCNMTLRNRLTHSSVVQTYVVVRVFPTVLRPSDLAAQIISGNDVSSRAVAQAAAALRRTQQPPMGATGRAHPSIADASSGAAPATNVLRFVGQRATLRLNPPASQTLAAQFGGRNSSNRAWGAISVTPSFVSNNDYTGTALILRNVSFVMDDAAATSVEHGGGTVVQLLGFTTPGVYTLRYRQLDPMHPLACPPVSFHQLVQVYRAQVVTATIVVCDSDAVLQAVPLPQELHHEFHAQWEVVSRQDADGDDAVRTSGADLAGMRFDHSARPRTVVHGLSFGVVTVRWAIYKNVLAGSGRSGDPVVVASRVLVDEARATIFVLTENLRTNRVVTLSDTIDVAVTSSTYHWRFAEPNEQRFSLTRSSSLLLHPSNSTFKPSMMTVDRLRIGVTRLKYDLRPSARVHLWALLQNLSCPITPPTTLFEIERVTAFLSVRQHSGRHECDAYSGHFNLTVCLEAGDKVSAPFFNERVALVDAGVAERVIKEDAMAFAAATGCAVPWWTTDRSVWTSAFTFEDHRCLFVAARARNHLSPLEAAHPTFEATMPIKRTSATSELRQMVGGPCHAGSDIITSRIVEGVDAQRSPSGDDAAAGDGASSGVRPFLAILDPISLRPLEHKPALEPLVGYATAEDTVVMESQLAGGSGAPPASVVLQLDTVFASFPSINHSGGHAFLDRCIDQTLTLHDTARHWNVGLERTPLTQRRWADYLNQADTATVKCEILFASIEHMLARATDTVDSLNARRAQPIPQHLTRFVSIVELEKQLDALNRSHHWTRDGIEVTGLPPELRSALNRKRLTRQQLAEVQRYREQQRQQHVYKDAADEHGTAPFRHTEGGEVAELEPQDAVVTQHPGAYRERIAKAIPAYKSWLEHLARPTSASGTGIISALRLTLPRASRFAAPQHFSLRAALHKDAVCDTNVASSDHHKDNAQVVFHRVVVRDEAPTVAISPLRVKQCDVEVAMPPIVVRLGNVNFKEALGNMTHADLRLRVEVHETVNPNATALMAAERSRHDYANDAVGLKPCLGNFVRGARIALLDDNHRASSSASASQKELEIQFAPCPAFLMLSNEEYNERQEGDQLLERLQHPRLLHVTVHNVVELDSYGGSESISFTVVVAPTLVRTQLRGPGEIDRNAPLPTLRSPLLTDGLSPEQLPAVSAPMICEATLKRSGFELGLELVGDEWHPSVGASFSPALDNDRDQLLTRTQQDVALLNAFSLVEHHRLDAASFAFLLIGGGIYRSHFIHYLFSSVMVDAVASLTQREVGSIVAERQKYIHRYNSSFVGIRIPPSSANSDESASSSAPVPGGITSVPFTALEEILIAVPGITTQCKGCLLADRTFFVVGETNGVWEPMGLQTPLGIHRRASLAAPLLIPMTSADAFPRKWLYRWLCASSAASLVHRLADRYLHRSARGGRTQEPYLVTEVHVLASRDVLGRALPPHAQPKGLFASQPVFLSDLHRSHAMGLTSFVISDDAVDSAIETMFNDIRRFDTKHLTTVYDYIRDNDHSGSLAVNATTILKLCLSERECVVLFYHPSLLMMRPLRPADGFDTSVLGELLQPLVLLHHAGTLAVFYVFLQRRGVTPATKADTWLPLAILACVLLVTSIKIPMLWVALWLGVWSLTLREYQEIGAVVLFGIHGLVYAVGVARR